ncbi:MAG TPA: hypothetical protein VIX81_07625 [Gammaproteobacteria bacterium]
MESRRDHLKRLLAAGAVGGLGGWAHAVHAMLADRQVSGGFHRLVGEVRLNGRPARIGEPVRAGDSVTTGADGEAVYVIGRDAFLQRADSETGFGGETAVAFFRLVTGALLSVFGPGRRNLKTPVATIGIRGTACYLEAQPRRTYFCLCYGRAELVPDADPGHVELLETRHHDHPLYLNHDAGLPMMVDAELVNHTDAELERLEALCARVPPFTGAPGMMRKG